MTPRHQLFMPGRPAGGEAVEADFLGGHLELRGDGLHERVRADALGLRLGGADGRQWLLEWTATEGRAALLLASPEAARRLLAAAPASLAGQVADHERRHRRQGRRFGLLAGIVVALVLLPLLLVGLFIANGDRLAGWAAGHVSLEQEKQLGDLAFGQMKSGLKLLETGPAPAMVQDIGARLTRGSRYSYQWFVADSPEVNAFAMPGGYVVVYTGLLREADGAEEVAGVLAHEVQHVELRHSLKNMIHGLGWRAALSLAMGDMSGGLLADLAGQLGSLSYSRDLEREADLHGLKALRQAGIAPEGMPRFFEKLARRDGAGLALLSSHPSSDERMNTLKQAIAAQGSYPSQPLAYDWAALQASLGPAPAGKQ